MGISSGVLAPVFASGTTSYTAKILAASITLTPTTTDPTATVLVNGMPVTSGTASTAINLNIGANIITTIVTAQDGKTTDTYTVTIYRGSTNAALSNVTLSSGTLSPAFHYTTYAYTASVATTTTSVTVTPTAADATATITVNGIVVATKTASEPIALAVGQNTITTTVKAQDGFVTDSYTIIVNRNAAGTNNAALYNLLLSSGMLSPAFHYTTTSYTASVTNAIAAMTVTPIAAGVGATIKVNGITVASNASTAPIPLSVGANHIIIVVTAADDITTDTYTVTATRAASSTDAWLQQS